VAVEGLLQQVHVCSAAVHTLVGLEREAVGSMDGVRVVRVFDLIQLGRQCSCHTIQLGTALNTLEHTEKVPVVEESGLKAGHEHHKVVDFVDTSFLVVHRAQGLHFAYEDMPHGLVQMPELETKLA
jgi:hypothetical protein